MNLGEKRFAQNLRSSRRSWCCSPDPSGRRRRARRPAHASLVRAGDPCERCRRLSRKILMAFLDGVYIASSPLRVGHSFAVLQEQLLRHSNIRVHLGKMKVWNSSGVRPRACDTLQDIATASGSLDHVWKGSDLPTEQQGIKVLGTPVGHRDFVASHLARELRSHQTWLERIPAVQDVQCAWALLLHSAARRANYQLPVVRPELMEGFCPWP